MLTLKDKHKGETVWIIGKGMSLRRLIRPDIGSGPIIALGATIVPIEIIGFPNPLYSLQKDGGMRKRHPSSLHPECDDRQCDYCEGVVRPRKSTLLMHELEAKYCFENYKPRILFTLEDIGMPHNEFSLVCAIKIGQLMGCKKFKFVSFDVHANGNPEHLFPVMSPEYYNWAFKLQKKILLPYLEGLDYEWVTPK